MAKQPKTLAKDPRFKELTENLSMSRKLQKVRITPRCYRLLDQARIQPEHISNFIRTYRLPDDTFFTIFFDLKRAYLTRRQELKEQRKDFILNQLKALSPEVRKYISLLAKMEQKINHAGKNPVWNRVIVPSTKKAALQYNNFAVADWAALTEEFGCRLQERYPDVKTKHMHWDRIFSAFLLDCLPQSGENVNPEESLIRRQYRRLARMHHPDTGGNEKTFRMLKEARDILLS